MTASYCLGGFAKTIRDLQPASWREALAQVPINCPHGCKTDGCYAVCRDYARMQWRIGDKRKEAGR